MNSNLYLLDLDKTTVGVLSNRMPFSLPFFEDLQERSLDDLTDTLTLKVPASHPQSEMISVDRFILYPSLDEGYKLYKIKEITETSDENGYVKELYCEISAQDDLIKTVVKPTNFDSATLEEVIEYILAGTSWAVGQVDDLGEKPYKIEDYTNSLEALVTAIQEFGGEHEFDYELLDNSSVIVGQSVSVYEKTGEETGLFFTHGKDVKGVERIEDTSQLVTALMGVGKANEAGVPLTFESHAATPPKNYERGADWLGSVTALEAYSDGKHIMGVFKDDNAQSPAELYRNTLEALKKYSKPLMTYKVSLILLEKLTGYEHMMVRLGDTIVVQDETVNPPLYVKARVRKLSRSITNPINDAVELGDYIPVVPPVNKKLAKLQDKIRAKEETWNKAEEIPAIQEKLDQVPTKDDLFSTPNQRLKVRYIRDYINGSTANSSNHWVELQVLKQGKNIAKGIIPTSGTSLSNPEYLTDGIVDSSRFTGATGGLQYVQLDLGAVVSDVEYLHVWHYYNDARAYSQHYVDVSEDGLLWIRMYNSDKGGTVTETEKGHIIPINSSAILSHQNDTVSEIVKDVETLEEFKQSAEYKLDQKVDVNEYNEKVQDLTQDLADKAGLDYVDGKLMVKADAEDLESLTADVAKKAGLEYVDGKLVAKADKATTYSKTEVDNAVNGKVSKTDYNTDQAGIVERFESQGTAIEQNEKDIALKAEKTTVDTLAGRVTEAESSLEVQAGQISTKVTQTEVDKSLTAAKDYADGKVDTVVERVVTAETAIKQNKDAIALKASKTDLTAVETDLGKAVSRITDAESSLSVQADQISSKVSKTEFDAITNGEFDIQHFARHYYNSPVIVRNPNAQVYKDMGVTAPPLGAVFGNVNPNTKLPSGSIDAPSTAWAIINTAKIYKLTEDAKALETMKLVADFAVKHVIDADFYGAPFKLFPNVYNYENGSWIPKTNFVHVRTFYHMAWALLEAYRVTKDERYATVAKQLLDGAVIFHNNVKRRATTGGELGEWMVGAQYNTIIAPRGTTSYSPDWQTFTTTTLDAIYRAITAYVEVIGDENRADGEGTPYRVSEVLAEAKEFMRGAYNEHGMRMPTLGVNFNFYRFEWEDAVDAEGRYHPKAMNWDFNEDIWGTDQWFTGDLQLWSITGMALSGLTKEARELYESYYALRVKSYEPEIVFYDRYRADGSHMPDDDSISIVFSALFLSLGETLGIKDKHPRLQQTIMNYQVTDGNPALDGGYAWDISQPNQLLESKTLGEIVYSPLESIGGLINQAEYLDSRITVAESAITQNADAIKMRVTKEEAKDIARSENNLSFRYVRYLGEGSDVNPYSHIIELAVIDSEKNNVAKGILPVGGSELATGLEYITNGVTSNSTEYADLGESLETQWFMLDLGEIHSDIDAIKIWHYYVGGRQYRYNLQVSEDGINWIGMYDTGVNGLYQATSAGFEIFINQQKAIYSFASQFTQTAESLSLKADADTVDDLGNRLSSAEELITPESIVSTVTSSEEYNSALDEKADSTALDGKANVDDLDAVRTDIETNYATKAEVTQTSTDIDFKFQSAGGVNLLKNSVGFAGKDFWSVTGLVDTGQPVELEQRGAGSGFYMNGGSLVQSVAVRGGSYTVSAIVKKDATGTGYLKATYDTDQIKEITFQAGTEIDFEVVSFVIDVEGTQIDIELQGSSDSGLVFTSLMMNVGSLPLQWSHSTGEVYSTNIQFNERGITVKSSEYDGFTTITPEKFAGYYNSSGEDGEYEEVFSLNKDTTQVNKLDAKQEINMSPIKIVPIQSGTLNGWAFVASDE